MRKIHLLLFVVLQFLAIDAFAQFEGVIKMKMTSKQANGDMTFSLSDKGQRMDADMTIPQMSGPAKTSVIMRKGEPDVVYVLMHMNKSYMKMNKQGNPNAQAKDDKKYTVKNLGKEKMAGYMCQHVKVTGESMDMDLWTTKEFMDFYTFQQMQDKNSKMANSALYTELKKAGADGFPVKVIQTVEGDKMTMELVSATKQSVPASAFDIPAGYGDMSGMMQMSPDQMKQMQEMMRKRQPK
ncbi:MAG: DUF4412 domain-containing protein [Chlorobiales bacterium]|nr:DUF4412 domain-containing protein [Chlorobiales bacterium]